MELTEHHVARFHQLAPETDGCWEWSGARDGKNYGRMYYRNGKSWLAHRVSYTIHKGPIPDGMLVDHICHNPGCVNPGHLRAVTRKENGENRSGSQRNNTSGVNGVYWDKAKNAWCARVHHNGRKVQVGLFSDLDEAAAAVAAKRLELFTHNERDKAAA